MWTGINALCLNHLLYTFTSPCTKLIHTAESNLACQGRETRIVIHSLLWNTSTALWIWYVTLLKNKTQTWCHLLFYFNSYVLNMFRTLVYPSSGACDCAAELPHWLFCSWFGVCWRFNVVGLEWYPCCRLSLQHGYHSNPTTPKLQHTSNQEQYDQCGNSTE